MICIQSPAPGAVRTAGGSLRKSSGLRECPRMLPAGKYWRTKAWLMMAKEAPWVISVGVQIRPSTRGVSRVWKYSESTRLNLAYCDCGESEGFPNRSKRSHQPLLGG